MHYTEQRRQAISHGIQSLWKNWALSLGLLTLLTVCAPFVSGRFVPVLAIALEFVMVYLNNVNSSARTPSCWRIPHIAQVVLLISTIIMVIFIIYASTEGATEFGGQAIDTSSAMIPTLIISPLLAVVCLYYMLRPNKSVFSRSFQRRRDGLGERNILGNIFTREATFQTRLLFSLSLILSVISWTYYITSYVNVNINSSDRYYFIILPLAMYLLTLVYLGLRYHSLRIYYCENEATARLSNHTGTVIRYLILCDDRILLSAPNEVKEILTTDDFKVDTSLKVEMPYRDNIPLSEAIRCFKDVAGVKNAEIRPLYESRDYGMYDNTFHFAVFIPKDESEKAADELNGQWFTLNELHKLIVDKMACSKLSLEIDRIYRTVMAWKTYDKSGKRLYPIKNYRPTFRLRDLSKYDVDFNDTNWLYIGALNQDKPFYRLRRAWNKYFNADLK